jgi:hypothetical protein
MKSLLPAAILLTSVLGLAAQDVPPEAQVKFIRLLVSSSGQSGFACGSNMALKFKLQSVGFPTPADAKIAWASSEAEVKALKAAGRFAVVPQLAWLKLGAAAALVQEGGNPVLYLNLANVKASGLTLPDSVVKSAKLM